MTSGSRLVLDLTSLLEEHGTREHLQFDESVDGLDTELVRIGGKEPLHFDLHVQPMEEGILVRGTIAGEYATTCRRCLDGDRERFELEVAEVFRPRADAWEEGYVIQDGTVDLRAMVRDNVLLEMPVNPLCDADCRGLCGRCGANLNAGPCRCPVEEPDERWTALRSLLER